MAQPVPENWSTPEPFGPDHIRSLRGTQSRAAFARVVGVTEKTVYRWELPRESRESRRPRGAERARLADIADHERPADAPPVEAPREAALVPSVPADLSSDDMALVLPAFERAFAEDGRAASAELVEILAREPSLSPASRALAHAAIAIVQILHRGDTESAMATLGSPIRIVETLPPRVAAWVFAAAALAHASPHGRFFNIGRVHTYEARVEALVTREQAPEAVFLAWLASLNAATIVGEQDLLNRATHRFERCVAPELPPLLALLAAEMRGFHALVSGQTTACERIFEEILGRPDIGRYPLVKARALAYLAVRRLEDLAEPEGILALAQSSLRVAAAARVGPGIHTILATRAAAEAFLRLGRMDEALSVLREVEAFTDETGLPPAAAIPCQTRIYFLAGRVQSLSALAERLRAVDIPQIRAVTAAYAAFVDAFRILAIAEDPKAAVVAFAAAEEQAGRWNFLLRDALVFGVTARIFAGYDDDARIAIRRALRFLESAPSPWALAHVRRLEGALLASQGHWAKGKKLIESAIATFELAGDKTDAAMARHMVMTFAKAHGEEVTPEALEANEQDLAAMGLVVPRCLRFGVQRMAAAQSTDPACPRGQTIRVEGLVVPLQRLSMRGATPALILKELMSVTHGLLPAHILRLEEIDSGGRATVLDGPASLSVAEWSEFGDGAGRRLRIGSGGVLSEEERSTLDLLALIAGQSLELSAVRGLLAAKDGAGAPDDEVQDLPDFIAASEPMRFLRQEIGRLRTSKATVILAGESGAGKEVVARALHDLSSRAGGPYVAFNCAAVPRDLFEGQLFGYRKGAFTGAVADHAGVIRGAHNGTLFLDEIGELPLDVQPKLLRFLENGEVLPLGYDKPVRVDVRVIAATHRDLGTLVREGRFREDLYYRLQVVPMRVPPLRERREDIAPLAKHFLRKLSPEGEVPILAPDALAALVAHPWPGNVRELRNVIERAMAFTPLPRVLREEHLRLGI